MQQRFLRFTHLTPHQQHLVTTIQQLRFGCIEQLAIRDGQPIFDPDHTRLLRRIRIKGTNAPHSATDVSDYALKAEVIELLQHFQILGNALVRSLTVVDGLPTDLIIEDVASPVDGEGL